MMDRRNFLRTASSFTLLTVEATTDASRTTGESIGKYLNLDKLPGMCAKEPMTADGIIRLSKIEVYPQVSRQVHKLCDRSGRNIPA